MSRVNDRRRRKETELEDMVRQAFIKDGDIIEKEIEKGNGYEPDEQDAQELYQRIMTRIEAEEAAKKAETYKTDCRYIPTVRLEREEFRNKYRRKRKLWKRVKSIGIVVSTICVFWIFYNRYHT